MFVAALLLALQPPAPAELPLFSQPGPPLPTTNAFARSSSADDGGVYFQLSAGLTSARDSGGPATAPDLEYDNGELYGVALGLHFGTAEALRLGLDVELEVIYSEQDIEAGGGLTLPSTSSFAAAMVNALLEFSLTEQLSVYGGAGIGIAAFDIDDFEDGVNTFEQDENAQFAWQIKTGLRVRLSRHVSLSGGYRWLQIADDRLTDDVNDVSFDLETGLHTVELGLRFTL